MLHPYIQRGHTRDWSEWVRSGAIWIDPRNAFTLRDVFVTQRVKLDYFAYGYRRVSSCGLEIMASNGGLGQDQYTRLLLLMRSRVSCLLLVPGVFGCIRGLVDGGKMLCCKILRSMTGLITFKWVGTLPIFVWSTATCDREAKHLHDTVCVLGA